VLQWMRDMIAVSYSITTYRNMVPALDYALAAIRAQGGGECGFANLQEHDAELVYLCLTDLASFLEENEGTIGSGTFNDAGRDIRSAIRLIERLTTPAPAPDAELRAEVERLRHDNEVQMGALVAQGRTIAALDRLRSALEAIAAFEWKPKCGFCHPEGCESPRVAREALAHARSAGGEG
jgi:hypothetical protein